jgi:hypothetical protein
MGNSDVSARLMPFNNVGISTGRCDIHNLTRQLRFVVRESHYLTWKSGIQGSPGVASGMRSMEIGAFGNIHSEVRGSQKLDGKLRTQLAGVVFGRVSIV